MYHHVKKLMYTVRVDDADPKFGNMLLEQFGGANGELGPIDNTKGPRSAVGLSRSRSESRRLR